MFKLKINIFVFFLTENVDVDNLPAGELPYFGIYV